MTTNETPSCKDMCKFMETLADMRQRAAANSCTDPVTGIEGHVVNEHYSRHEWHRRRHPEHDYARSKKMVEVFLFRKRFNLRACCSREVPGP